MSARLLLPVLVVLLAAAAPAQIVFVDADATGASDGTSWEDAFPSLQDALDAVVSATFWVAEGVYRPTAETVSGSPRSATFTLLESSSILGGFDGTETSAGQRDPVANPTVLSGDIGVPGDPLDNAFHVVTASGLLGTELDGVVVREGRADGASDEQRRGGGLLQLGGIVTVTGCAFEDNFASGAGGGWFALGGLVTAEDCTFLRNVVDELENTLAGGGMCTFQSNAEITGCLFEDNEALGFSFAAGLKVQQGSAVVRDSVFRDNVADGAGGMALSQADGSLLEDLLFEGNFGRFSPSALRLSFLDAATVRGCTFAGNEMDVSGSTVSTQDSDVVFDRCRFEDNVAPLDGSALSLGFLFANDVVVKNCDFVGNEFGRDGGALRVFESSPLVVGCRFLGNVAGDEAGAVEIGDQGSPFGTSSQPLFADCLFSGNQAAFGAAVQASDQSRPTFVQCSFAGNVATDEGGGIRVVQEFINAIDVTVVNSVLWDNADAGGQDESAQIALVGDAGLSLDFSCVEGLSGGLGGTGNIGLDPLFTDADGPDDVLGTGDDHPSLGAGSPCVDAGDTSALPADSADLDCDGDALESLALDLGLVRRRDDDPFAPDRGTGAAPVVDMGAFERGAWTHLGAALGTSAVEASEPCLVGEGVLLAGTPADHQLANARPNATAALFFGLSRIDAPFKQGVLVPAPDILAVLTTSPQGTASGPVVWPAGVPSGTAFFMQYWIVDPLGPAGFSASNAIGGVTP